MEQIFFSFLISKTRRAQMWALQQMHAPPLNTYYVSTDGAEGIGSTNVQMSAVHA